MKKKPRSVEGVVLTADEAEWIRHARDAKTLGRPKKYHPKYCRMAFEKMASGFSKEATAGALGISEKTLYNWMKKKDFLQAIELGMSACREHWEHIGYLGATGRIPKDAEGNPIPFKFNGYAWGLNMKNRFKWGERVMDKGSDEAGSGASPIVFEIELDHKPEQTE